MHSDKTIAWPHATLDLNINKHWLVKYFRSEIHESIVDKCYCFLFKKGFYVTLTTDNKYKSCTALKTCLKYTGIQLMLKYDLRIL